jgi:HK97 family phage major capsid protein
MRAVRGTQVRAFDFSDMTAQAVELEARAARADELERRATFSVREPSVYQRGGPNSWVIDVSRMATGRGDTTAASQRLGRHLDELAVTYPAWREARARAAAQAYEKAFAADRRGEILLERMEKFGLAKFRSDDAFEKRLGLEHRALNRTDGTGGEFAPPLWLVDLWATAPRAGRAFADLWTPIPLPAGCSSVNVPHFTVGLATGPDTDGASVPASSAADSYASSAVTTIAGTQDVSMAWCEQIAPPGADAILFKDLADDAAGSLDAQLLIGSGIGQLKGIIVGGAASASNLVVIANNQNVSGSTITVATGETPVYTSVAHMLKVMGKARGKRATHIVLNDGTWWDIAGTIDTTGKPIVPMSASAPSPGPDGALGTAWALPVIGDNQLPLTFGGTSAPTVATSGAVTAATAGNGSYAVIIGVRAPDLYLFEGGVRLRVYQDILSGTGQWRFMLTQYVAALRDRYTAGSTISFSSGSDSGGVNSGGTPSAGVVTNYETNSPLAGE